MKISEAMSRDVRIAAPSQSICDAARLMAELGVGALPVGENDRLIGMITDRDITVRAVANRRGPETSVRDIMSSQIKYCFDDEPTDEVARKMGNARVRRLPVLNRNKRLVGIVSLGDVSQRADGSAGEALQAISEPGVRHSQQDSPR